MSVRDTLPVLGERCSILFLKNINIFFCSKHKKIELEGAKW